MKELSIEDKAKAYDKLFVKAQQIYNKENDVLILHTIEDLFPELKENENEKWIPKEIANYLKEKGDFRSCWITWLEKQCEQNLDTDFSDLRTWKYIVDAVWTEKEGIGQYLDSPFTEEVAKKLQKRFGNIEQKPTDKVEPKFRVGDYIERKDGLGCHAKIIFVGGNVYGCEKLIHSEDESPFFEFMFKNQDEFQISSDFKQKSACNVEPKFHEGDWLCENEPNNYARFIQILEIVNVQGKYRYRISRDIHKDEDVVEFGFVEKYYHKFDTQDAKDGDALFVKPTENLGKQLIIFGGIDSNGRIKYYCRFLNNKFSINGGLMGYDHKYFLPATKEQRDTLFKAMANAGYEWDADKKELKKIEQKSTWSEEDEEMFGYALDMIEWYSGKNEDKSRAVSDWLKSLRPQNTWKPSDEQLEYLLTIKTLSPSPLLESLYVDLKKLREE